jgi:putative hemolysin
MNHSVKIILGIAVGLLLISTAGLVLLFALFAPVRSSGPGNEPEATARSGGAALPNPASAYCEDYGGKLEIRTTADGSQQGACIFPDGSVCDEWAFYRRECGPAGMSAEVSGATLALNAKAASPGRSITVTGIGFEPDTSVALRLGARNSGLGKQNLATIVADERGAFEAVLTLPVVWPGTQQLIIEPELVIAAVDETLGQTLAVVSFLNESAEQRQAPLP